MIGVTFGKYKSAFAIGWCIADHLDITHLRQRHGWSLRNVDTVVGDNHLRIKSVENVAVDVKGLDSRNGKRR